MSSLIRRARPPQPFARRWFGPAAVAAAVSLSACEEGASGPTTPGAPAGGGRIERVEIVSTPASGDTMLEGEELVFAVWLSSGETVEVLGEVSLLFGLGLATQPAILVSSDGGFLEFRYRIRRGDYDGDGVGVPAGELVLAPGASLRVGGGALDYAVPELPPDGAHRVFARYLPGETLVFDAVLDGFPVESLGLPGAVGCAGLEDFISIAEGVLEGNLAGAVSRYGAARRLGECGELIEGDAAIFLSARITEHGGQIYDLALAYGPAETVAGLAVGNWWTLADFLREPE